MRMFSFIFKTSFLMASLSTFLLTGHGAICAKVDKIKCDKVCTNFRALEFLNEVDFSHNDATKLPLQDLVARELLCGLGAAVFYGAQVGLLYVLLRMTYPDYFGNSLQHLRRYCMLSGLTALLYVLSVRIPCENNN